MCYSTNIPNMTQCSNSKKVLNENDTPWLLQFPFVYRLEIQNLSLLTNSVGIHFQVIPEVKLQSKMSISSILSSNFSLICYFFPWMLTILAPLVCKLIGTVGFVVCLFHWELFLSLNGVSSLSYIMWYRVWEFQNWHPLFLKMKDSKVYDCWVENEWNEIKG